MCDPIEISSLQNRTQFSSDWTAFKSLCESKLMLVMLTKSFHFMGKIGKNTTVLNLCPGLVQTNMLAQSDYNGQGKSLENANDTFILATK